MFVRRLVRSVVVLGFFTDFDGPPATRMRVVGNSRCIGKVKRMVVGAGPRDEERTHEFLDDFRDLASVC